MTSAALGHIKVLDLSRLFPGPYATQMLADLGAEVVKVEAPGEGDYMRHSFTNKEGRSFFFDNLNRNKESLCLDLKKPEAKETLKRLAAKCDVLIESFRPGVMERLGVGYETLREKNPGLVYCTITGYGTAGPLANDAGHDLNYIAMAGLLSLLKDEKGKPIVPGFQIADVGGGALHAVIGILAALTARGADGLGRRVDVSMTDVIMPWMVYAWSEYQANDEGEEAGVLNGKFPCYNVYETADRKFLAVGALEHKFWKALLKRLGLEKHIDSQFAKGAVREEIFSELRALFLSKTREEWLRFLEGADCCVTPILELDELAGHPYVTARGLIRPDISWSAAPGALTPPLTLGFDPGAKEPPALGGNTLEVLKRFGFGDDEVAALKKAGALG